VAHTTLSVPDRTDFPQNFATIIDRKIQPLFDLVDSVYTKYFPTKAEVK